MDHWWNSFKRTVRTNCTWENWRRSRVLDRVTKTSAREKLIRQSKGFVIEAKTEPVPTQWSLKHWRKKNPPKTPNIRGLKTRTMSRNKIYKLVEIIYSSVMYSSRRRETISPMSFFLVARSLEFESINLLSSG